MINFITEKRNSILIITASIHVIDDPRPLFGRRRRRRSVRRRRLIKIPKPNLKKVIKKIGKKVGGAVKKIGGAVKKVGGVIKKIGGAVKKISKYHEI